MKTVYHPTIPDLSYEVDESVVDEWKEAGWRLSKPRPQSGDTETAAATTAADKGQHPTEEK